MQERLDLNCIETRCAMHRHMAANKIQLGILGYSVVHTHTLDCTRYRPDTRNMEAHNTAVLWDTFRLHFVHCS